MVEQTAMWADRTDYRGQLAVKKRLIWSLTQGEAAVQALCHLILQFYHLVGR